LGLIGAAAIRMIPAWSSLSGVCAVMVWCVALAGLAQSMVQNMLFGVFRFSAGNMVEVVARLGLIAGMVIAWRLGWTTAAWFAGIFTASTAAATWWGMRASGIRPSVRSWDGRLWREQMRIGSRVYVACLASFLLTRLPIYAVESRGGLKGLAFFTQAMLVADTMLVLPASLGTVLFPSLASTRGSSLRIRSTLRLAAIVACIMLLAVAAAAWLGPIAFPLIYGKAYAASMPILFAMLPGVATLGVCSVMQNALSANGYPWAAVASPVAGVLAVSLGLYFTDTVIGCGWAYSIGAAVMLSFSSVAWWFHRHDWSEIGESAASADHLPT
jgi:O-antigen/teichoic acid export membrane protein